MVGHLQTGLMTELRGQLLYASRGYDIFLPVSQHTPVDFVAYRHCRPIRVQAKTAGVRVMGGRRYIAAGLRGSGSHRYKPDDFDELYVTDGKNEWVIPWRAVCGRSDLLLSRIDENGQLCPRSRVTSRTVDTEQWRVK